MVSRLQLARSQTGFDLLPEYDMFTENEYGNASELERRIDTFTMSDHARELTRQVNEHIQNYDDHVRQQIVETLEAGRKLSLVKDMIPHGSWETYIEQCTAYRNMRHAQRTLRFWNYYKDKAKALRHVGIAMTYDDMSHKLAYSLTQEEVVVTVSALHVLASKDAPSDALDMMLSKLSKMKDGSASDFGSVNLASSDVVPNSIVSDSIDSDLPVTSGANGYGTVSAMSGDNDTYRFHGAVAPVSPSRQGTLTVSMTTAIAKVAKTIDSLQTQEGRDFARWLFDVHDVMNTSLLELADDIVKHPDIVSEMRHTGYLSVASSSAEGERQIPVGELGRSDIEIAIGAVMLEDMRSTYTNKSRWVYQLNVVGSKQTLLNELSCLPDDKVYRIEVKVRAD